MSVKVTFIRWKSSLKCFTFSPLYACHSIMQYTEFATSISDSDAKAVLARNFKCNVGLTWLCVPVCAVPSRVYTSGDAACSCMKQYAIPADAAKQNVEIKQKKR
jgi:hypothetical protein